MERRSKTVFQLDTPYSEVRWPQIDPADQDTVLELLTSLISPIGQYRARHNVPSSGKRSKKRKRQQLQAKNTASKADLYKYQLPPTPEISSYVTVGAATVLRLLQLDSHTTATGSKGRPLDDTIAKANADGRNTHPLVIFTCRFSQPAFLQSLLPHLIGSASLAHNSQHVRLVQLPKGCEGRLSSSLGLPRVSILALLGNAPHSKALLNFVLDRVPAIDVPWMTDIKNVRYQALNINAVQTTAPLDRNNKTKI